MLAVLSRRHQEQPRSLLLDEQLPDDDAVVRRHVVVEAPVSTTYESILTTDLTESGRLVSLLNALRFLPARVRAAVRGETPPMTDDRLTLGDLPTEGVWVRLDDVPDEEFVFGAVGRVWKPDIDWAEITAEEFRDFDRPGYAKIAAGISVRAYGPDRSLVTYEARTVGTDDEATRRFRRYWVVVKPFAGYVMRRALGRMKVVAEGASE